MNKKNLLQGLLLLIVSLTLAIVGILWFYPENGRNFSGMLVFEQTSNRGADMDKVVISNGKNKVILTLQDGFWRIPGAGNGYYANFALSNALFMNMNQSRYFTEIEAGDKNSVIMAWNCREKTYPREAERCSKPMPAANSLTKCLSAKVLPTTFMFLSAEKMTIISGWSTTISPFLKSSIPGFSSPC